MTMNLQSWTALGAVVTALATIFLVVATAVLAKATNRLNDISGENRRSERVKLTRDLYNQFFSLTEYRSKAWFWLEALESHNPQPSFEQLWKVRDQTNFMELYRVLAFWFLFYRLYQAEELDKKLAVSLFAYELFYWSRQVNWLVKRTVENDKVFPDVLEPFEQTTWLLSPGNLPRAAKLHS